jgi:hypothetical protein
VEADRRRAQINAQHRDKIKARNVLARLFHATGAGQKYSTNIFVV